MNSKQEEQLSAWMDRDDSPAVTYAIDSDPEMAAMEKTVRFLQSERVYEAASADFAERGLERIRRESAQHNPERGKSVWRRKGILTAAASLLLVIAAAVSPFFNQAPISAAEIRVKSNLILDDLGVLQALNPQYLGNEQEISYGAKDDKIVIWNRSTGKANPFPLDFSYMRDMAWSPDGSRAAFSGYQSAQSGPVSPGIWIVNRDGSNPVQVAKPTDADTAFEAPAWSPDGRSIAYTSTRAELSDATGVVYRYHIEVVNADGTNRHTVAEGKQPSWSPDGKKLAYSVVLDTGESEIWTLNRADNEKRKLAQGEMPVWSPKGHFIAYSKTRTEHKVLEKDAYSADISYHEIWAVNVDSGAETQLTVSGYPKEQLDAMLAESRDRGEQQASFSVSGVTSDWDPDWSADGQRLLFTRDINEEKAKHFTLQELTLDY